MLFILAFRCCCFLIPVGFILLGYSVLCTVESLSLLNLDLYGLGDNAFIS